MSDKNAFLRPYVEGKRKMKLLRRLKMNNEELIWFILGMCCMAFILGFMGVGL